jgi:hypothetical protein
MCIISACRTTKMPNRFRLEVPECTFTRPALGAAAANRAAQCYHGSCQEAGRARVIVATGNPQLPLIEALVRHKLDWKNVEMFHDAGSV